MHTLCMEKPAIDEIARECGLRLRECREAAHMTQHQLSRATGYRVRKGGLSPSQIGNFEQGTRRIGHEEADILTRIFSDYPAAYFMGLVDKREAEIIILLRTGKHQLPKAG